MKMRGMWHRAGGLYENLGYRRCGRLSGDTASFRRQGQLWSHMSLLWRPARKDEFLCPERWKDDECISLLSLQCVREHTDVVCGLAWAGGPDRCKKAWKQLSRQMTGSEKKWEDRKESKSEQTGQEDEAGLQEKDRVYRFLLKHMQLS